MSAPESSGDTGRLRRAVDRMPVLLACLDASERYRFANERHASWSGIPTAALLGRSLREVFGEAAYESLRPHVETALSGREASHEWEVALAGREARWLAVTLSPDVAPTGEVDGLVMTAWDVTLRKAANHSRDARERELEAADRDRIALLERGKEELARSEDGRRAGEGNLRAILDSAVDGILTIDEAGAIQSFNPAAERLFGYEQGEVLGRNVSLLMPPPYGDEHDGYLRSYVRTGAARIIGIGREVEARRKSGDAFPIHLSVGEARLGDRRIFTGIIHDLSARKRLEAQLAQSQKMEAVGRLAGGVAHDFNNILLTILGRSDVLLRRMRPKDPLRRQVFEIRKAGRRAAALNQQLLAVSRTQVLKPRLVDLNAVLRETGDMLRRLIGEDVDFRLSLDPGLGAVEVDPHQIVQVVLNLVVNARDAMPRGGRLVVETRNAEGEGSVLPSGHAVLLAVRDNGMGMDEATQARVFEPYFTTKGDRGTGLGLSTVYGIVQQSGGVVRLRSRPGEGSTFSVYLPRAEGRAEATAEAERRSSPRTRGGRVLLVEDDAAARRALEEFLREEGHTVLSARSGDEAERLCQEAGEPIDVVVTDTVMPRMSGPKLVERLQALQPGLRAIFMSGHTPETVGQHGDIGGAVFLQKPFEIADLLAHVQALLAGPVRATNRGRRRKHGAGGSG